MLECSSAYNPASWMPDGGTIEPAYRQVFPDSSMAVFFSEHPTFAVFYDKAGNPMNILMLEEFKE